MVACRIPTSSGTTKSPASTNAPQALTKAFSAADDLSPDRVLLTLTAQPATSQAVSWRAWPTTNRPQAAILPAPGGPIDEKAASIVPAVVERVTYGKRQTLLHASVEFTNLQPATAYAYRVGDGKSWSEWNQFRTADTEPAPFRFLYLGDLQNGINMHGSRLLRAAALTAPDARFIVHAGDLVTDPFNDQLWYEWFAAAGWLYRVVPSFPAPGNHDLKNNAPSKIWRPMFALPHNGPPGQEELSFFTDYQGLRLVSFNGNAYDEPSHLRWLESVLQVPTDTWKVVVTHQPMYSTGQKRDATKRRELLMPIFDRCGVDLVLQGHDHTYGRTHKIHAGQITNPDAPGVVYATSVSGSKMYKLNPTNRVFMACLATNLQLFQVLSVSRDALAYEAYTADRRPFDAFELRRRNQRTTLVDRAPSPAPAPQPDSAIR